MLSVEVLSFMQFYLEALPLLRKHELIDCVLELTTVGKTQIANQHEVTTEKEKKEKVKVRDSYLQFIFLYTKKNWTGCLELDICRSNPNYC